MPQQLSNRLTTQTSRYSSNPAAPTSSQSRSQTRNAEYGRWRLRQRERRASVAHMWWFVIECFVWRASSHSALSYFVVELSSSLVIGLTCREQIDRHCRRSRVSDGCSVFHLVLANRLHSRRPMLLLQTPPSSFPILTPSAHDVLFTGCPKTISRRNSHSASHQH